MHYSGAFGLILLVASLIVYTSWTIALFFLFKIVRPISNCYIIKHFKPDNKTYEKTTATLKYFYGDYLLHYIVDEREFSVKIPYYIRHETISVIYMKRKPHKVIVDCPELWHKVIVKNLITSATIFISVFLIFKVVFSWL